MPPAEREIRERREKNSSLPCIQGKSLSFIGSELFGHFFRCFSSLILSHLSSSCVGRIISSSKMCVCTLSTQSDDWSARLNCRTEALPIFYSEVQISYIVYSRPSLSCSNRALFSSPYTDY